MRTTEVLIIGGGQAGLAASAHLRDVGIPHLVLEKDRIAEQWRTGRWDSLVMNGPAWHDRFPPLEFSKDAPDDFPTKDRVVEYFENFADLIDAPIQTGVEVKRLAKRGEGFEAETSDGPVQAKSVIVATGPFQVPVIPPILPSAATELAGLTQFHTHDYRNPKQVPDGGVLIVGAGSSGAQIADELNRDGRHVFLSIGKHDRQPRRYRGQDFVWWLGALGIWEMKTPPAGKEHTTIAVSGAYGGHTVDYRKFAERGVTLLGMADGYEGGVLTFKPDLPIHIAEADAYYTDLLARADAYADDNNLDLPEDPDAKVILPNPSSITDPILELDLAAQNIQTVIWATGYRQDFSWIDIEDALNDKGSPKHQAGVAEVDGLYFLGLPWLSKRGSSFVWGVWDDAKHLANKIAAGSK